MTLAELIARANEIVAKQQEMAGRDLTADEQKEFDTLDTEAESIDKKIKRLMSLAERSASLTAAGRVAAAAPVVAPAAPAAGNAVELITQRSNPHVSSPDLNGFQKVGVAIWAVAKNKHSPSKSALTHLEEAGFQRIADDCRAAEKAFNTITVNTGDNTIVTPLSSDYIETLRNESIFLSGGPVPVDLSYGKLDIPGGASGVSGTYTAEGADIPYVQMTTRKVSLSAKHLSALTAVSNYNISVSPLAVAALAGDDLNLGLVLSMDSAGLRGDGTGNNPAGLLTLTHASHKFSVANLTAPTYAQVDTEAKNALTKIRASNVPRRRRRWLMANRTFTYLQFMRDGNGNLIYPGLSLPVPVWYDNIPVGVSEQIPTTLGAGTNESEIYLVDFGHVLMGEARALTLRASTEASYKNAGGTLVSAFSLDETVIRGICSHDFDMRHDKASVVMQAVKWGA